MCAQSQCHLLPHVPIRQLFSGMHSGIFRDEVYGLVRGYIDESYEGNKRPEFFTLSCTLAHGGEWEFIEAAWRWVLAEKNRELIAANRKPIGRYHAVDCYNRARDFAGWTIDERNEFCSRLFKVFEHFPTVNISLGVSAVDICAVWPENEENPLHFAYNILLRLLMLEIGTRQSLLKITGKVSLFYERSPYGEALMRGFNTMMDDPTFSYAKVFTTLAPMGWEDCIPLQPADLVAYEVFRDFKRRAIPGKEMHRSLDALVHMPEFWLSTKRVERQHLLMIREMHERGLQSVG